MKGFPDQLRAPQRVILQLLKSGARITVAQGNRHAQTTETRRIISRLREQGEPIKDFWMVKDGRRFKYYYIGSPLSSKGSTLDIMQCELEIS